MVISTERAWVPGLRNDGPRCSNNGIPDERQCSRRQGTTTKLTQKKPYRGNEKEIGKPKDKSERDWTFQAGIRFQEPLNDEVA